MSNSRSKGTALITDASAGIGAVYADRLAKRGYDLILVARNEARLKSLAARLKGETGRSVKVQRANLGDKAELAQVEAARRAISQRFGNAVPAPRYGSGAPARQRA
jgi:uncharacterized protein